MGRGEVDLVVVGADRIARNGDTANQIGTYGEAGLARPHAIPIEERDPREVQELAGRRITPAASPVRNPAFDVTPAALITAIVTERGIYRGPYHFSG